MRSWLGAALGLIAATSAALEVPPTPRRHFTDLAGVVAPAALADADARLAAIEQRTGHQVIAVLMPSLEGEPLEDFTVRCAEAWKVGRKGLDDGVIFFAFLNDRKMRLEVGYGLEDKIPDAIASRVLSATVKPRFAAGDYAGGVVAMASALEGIFRGEPPPAAKRQRRSAPVSFLGLVGLLMLIALMNSLSHPRTGRRQRGGGVFWGGGGFSGGGFSGGGFGGGGFSGGGGSFGGGGASGSW
jgi:uncharacterized protein